MTVRKSIFIIAAICFLLLSLPLVVVEWQHYPTYGHFFAYGVHIDVLSRDINIGIKGRIKGYSAHLTNFTFLSTQLTVCRTPGDTVEPPREAGWAVQRYDSLSGWQTVLDAAQYGFCRSARSDDVIELNVKAGASTEVKYADAVGLEDQFRKGDLARYVIFRKTIPRGDWQTAIYSVPFVIEDDVMRDKDGFLEVGN